MLKYEPDFSFEEMDDPRTWYKGPEEESSRDVVVGETGLDPAEYWQAAVGVVNAWSEYQAKKKLYVNATHDETRHKVLDVIKSKYGGDVRRVLDREVECSALVDIRLRDFASICHKFGVKEVSRDWLYHHLRESKEYQSLRGKCRRRMNASKPARSLKDI